MGSDLIAGITFDTPTFMAAAGLVITAYAGIWIVKRVIGLIRG